MKIRFLTLLLAICLLPCAASGEESAYLSGSDLKSIQPQYEAFLDALADLLIEKGLLTEEVREELDALPAGRLPAKRRLRFNW